ncbi:MAG: RNA polymerase sigma factor [Anaerolineae bacterium]
MDHSDRDLLERCLRGEDAAWLALAGLVRRLTGGLAAVYGLDLAVQEEIVQETLAECLRDECRVLRRFAGRSRLTTYLGAIVIRVAARFHRAQQAGASDGLSPVEDLIGGDDLQLARAEIWTAIQETLTPVDHLILRLAASGYTAQEIADRLAHLLGQPWTAAAVRQRKAQAIRRLRKALRER